MNVAHFYHVWADGHWHAPVDEHLTALTESGFDGRIAIGIVGRMHNCVLPLREIERRIKTPDFFVSDHGWEQRTLQHVHEFAQQHDGAVMYAHTKGAHDNTPFRAAWRRSMTLQVVKHWRENAELLEHHDLDVIGCHWLTEAEFPGIVTDTPFPMFGGNFWIARCEYVRRLPPVSDDNRYAAEAWIGLGDPKVLDLVPGWPGSQPFPTSRLVVDRR